MSRRKNAMPDSSGKRVSGQRIILGAVVFVCIAAFLVVMLLTGSGIHPALAARNDVDAIPVGAPANNAAPASPVAGESSKEVVSSTAVPAPEKKLVADPEPQTPAGLPDVDPHKALGSKTAPLAIEVFSDFQCPACKSLYTTTMKQVIENYVNTGKAYLIHRDYPLPMHAYSRVAARYGIAAARLGKFPPVEQVLFEKQEVWEQSGDVDGTVATVLSAADMAKVRALVKGGTLDAEIDKDYALGQSYHVNQTPTTIIHHNGQTFPVVGQQTYPIFHEFLDQVLSMK